MLRQDPDCGSSWILLRIIFNATSLLLSSPGRLDLLDHVFFFAILTYDGDDPFRQGVVLCLLWQLDEGATGLFEVFDVAAALADDHPRRRVWHDHLDDDGDGGDDDDTAVMMTIVC